MQITFHKSLKQKLYHALRPKIANRNCPFCDEPVTAKNLGGAFWYKGEFRFMHRNIVCLIGYAGYWRRLKGLGKPRRK